MSTTEQSTAVQEPPNPWGSCFDATAHNFVINREEPGMKVCHGICVANKEGQEGMLIGHAWLECDHDEVPQEDGSIAKGRIAIDCIWLKAIPVDHYRKQLQASYIVEYTPDEFMDLWHKNNYPGPWDPQIIPLCKK